MTKSVIVELSVIPEKFLENDLKAPQPHSQGCLYPYLETKKLLDGSNVFYPRVIGERDPNNPFCWRWAFNCQEKHNGVWKGKSIGSIPPGAVPMIRLMQQDGATREDIIAFIKRAKSKKTSPKLDVCKNFDNTKIKPVLPGDAPITVVLFAGGGGIEAGMVEAGSQPKRQSTSHFRFCMQRRKNRRFEQLSPKGVILGTTAFKLYQRQIKLAFIPKKQSKKGQTFSKMFRISL